jgi:hypothetical protein
VKTQAEGLQQGLKEYLEQLRDVVESANGGRLKEKGWVHASLYDLVLEEGRFYQAKPRPAWCPQMEVKMCCSNALAAALLYDLDYCEGYAYKEGLIPVEHAWCVDLDGKVVDPTWDDEGRGVAYFGIAVDPKIVDEITRAKGETGLFADWANGFPFLRVGFDVEKALEFYETEAKKIGRNGEGEEA